MARKSSTQQSTKARRPAKRVSPRGGPAPGQLSVPDYDDEVTDEQLRLIKDAVRQDVEGEELETADGPAW